MCASKTPPGGSGSASHALLLAALLVGALLLVACGPRHPASRDGEQQVLHLYNWADYLGYDTIAEFERETHIKVVLEFYDSNEVLETKMLAGSSGYDVVSTTTTFYGRQIKAGAYLPLDRARLPNWKNLDPAVLEQQARADPGNRYAMPYLHAMNGIAYNIDMVKARLPAAPVDSSALIFDPKLVAKLADCGVTFLDSAQDVLQLALSYLHLDPNSARPEDLRAAEEVVMAVRPYIRTFDSIDYWHQLASKEVCVSVAWSSDYEVAQVRAHEDATGANLAFILPKEGSNMTYNAFLIPAGAPNPAAAHRFLNYLLDPKVIARITNDIHYGNDNLLARAYVEPHLLEDPAVYPPPQIRSRLYIPQELGADYDRLRTRAWTHIKTGQ